MKETIETQDNTNHADRAHALVSPSGLHITMHCPGSIAMAKTVPVKPAGPAAERGTRIHEIAEKILSGQTLIEGKFDEIEEARKFVKYVKEQTAHCDTVLLEHTVTIGDRFYGTADVIALRGDTLVIIDLKTGGIAVEVQGNPQLMAYAMGAWRHLGEPLIKEVELHIFQFDKGEKDIIKAELFFLYAGEIAATVEYALEMYDGKTPVSVCAGDHCLWCRAKPLCSAHKDYLKRRALADFERETPFNPYILTPEQRELVVLNAKKVQKFIEETESLVLNELKRGSREYPHLELGKKLGNRKWDPEKTSEIVQELLDAGCPAPVKESLIGITEASNYIREMPDEWFAQREVKDVITSKEKRKTIMEIE